MSAVDSLESSTHNVEDLAEEITTNQKENSIMAVYSPGSNGHLVDIDHSGINIPIALFEKNKWEQLLENLSLIMNLYRYPGEQLIDYPSQ